MIPMRLSVFFVPFAVKSLTNSKSAADRFKVSGQRTVCPALCLGVHLPSVSVMLLPNVTPGLGGLQPPWRGIGQLRDLLYPSWGGGWKDR